MEKRNQIQFRKAQPLGLRVWHWLNLVAIAGLLLTAYLRKGWFSPRTNAQLLIKKAEELGVVLNEDTARQLAVSVRNPMWDWHYIFGFSLGGLLLFRLFVFLKNRKTPAKPALTKYVKLVKTGYIVFYAIVLYMVASGLLLYFRESLGIAKEDTRLFKEVHEWMIWFFSAFTLAHIAGVVFAENRGDQGLVSDMINGGDKG